MHNIVNTLLTKQLPEPPGKEIEVITVNYTPGAVDAIHRRRRGDDAEGGEGDKSLIDLARGALRSITGWIGLKPSGLS